MVNRSEGTPDEERPSRLKQLGEVLGIEGSRRDEIDFNELNISLKISYKTILLVFVAFNVANRLIEYLF